MLVPKMFHESFESGTIETFVLGIGDEINPCIHCGGRSWRNGEAVLLENTESWIRRDREAADARLKKSSSAGSNTEKAMREPPPYALH